MGVNKLKIKKKQNNFSLSIQKQCLSFSYGKKSVITNIG